MGRLVTDTAANIGFVLSKRSREGLRAAAGAETSRARGTNRLTAAPEPPRSSPLEKLSLLSAPPRPAGNPGLGQNRHPCDPVLSFVTSLELAFGRMSLTFCLTRCCGLSLGFPGWTSHSLLIPSFGGGISGAPARAP